MIARDAAGNTVTYTVGYTLMVTAPSIEITEVRMGRSVAYPACDPTELGPCADLPAGPSFTVGAGEEVVATVAVTNPGESLLTELRLIDYNVGGGVNPAGSGIYYRDENTYFTSGMTYWLRSSFTAPSEPGTYERLVGVTGVDAGGNTTTYAVAYTLIVAPPEIGIALYGLGREAIYPDCQPGSPTGCAPLYGSTEVRVGAGELITASFVLENTGSGAIQGLLTLDREVAGYTPVAGGEGIFIDLPTYQLEPATTNWQTVQFDAPLLRGTYERDVLIIARDLAGNAATARFTYTIVVEPPAVSIPDYGIGRAADSGLCTPEGSAGYTSCAPLFGQTAITATGGEAISAFLAVRNDGLASLREVSLVDYVTGSSPLTVTGGGIAYRNDAFNQPSGATYGIFVSFTAPSEPGVHERTVILRAWDVGGNIVSTFFTYTIEVVAPDIRALEWGIGLTRGTNCQEGGDLRQCGFAVGIGTISAGPGEPLVLHAKYGNGSALDLAYSSVTNGLTGETFVERSLPLPQGETVQAADHFNAPAAPGTYAFDLVLVGRDAAGNEDRIAIPLEITVTESRIGIDNFGVGRITGTNCFPGGDQRDCTFLHGNTTVELPAGEVFGLSVTYTNHGEGMLYRGSLTLLPDNETFQTEPAEIAPGANVNATGFFVAPTMAGVYDYAVVIAADDAAGNRVTRTIPFSVTVKGPSVRFDALGIGIVRGEACRYGGDLRECFDLDGTTSLEAAPGEEIGLLVRYENDGLATIAEGSLENEASGARFSTSELEPGQTSMVTDFFLAPATPGVYLYAVSLSGKDEYGNEYNREETIKLTVRCELGDYVQPTAVCADATVTVAAGETLTVDAELLDAGSSDNCSLATTFLKEGMQSFTCSDAGSYPLTLVAVDGRGNTHSCTATVQVAVSSAVYGANGKTCVTETIAVDPTGGWSPLAIEGRIVAEINPGAGNEHVAGVRVTVAEAESLTQITDGVATLGKRIGLDLTDEKGEIVQPNEAVMVRLYYLEAELDALVAAGRATTVEDLRLLKSDDAACDRVIPSALQEVTALAGKSGCSGADGFLEFKTTSFSTFTLFSSLPALPVEMLAFTARAMPSGDVLLRWETATETDNDFFAVERSTDGRLFTEVGRVAGSGNSRHHRLYTHLDQRPPAGMLYYRLRQVDYDGGTTYGEVRTVKSAPEAALRIFPNPVADDLTLHGFAGGTVTILDARGRRIGQRSLGAGETLSVRQLAAGHYTLRFAGVRQAGSLSFVKR